MRVYITVKKSVAAHLKLTEREFGLKMTDDVVIYRRKQSSKAAARGTW